MGVNFRKSINLGGGVRLNLSKKGIGVSAGVKGARVSVGPRGIRRTVSIPGTGLYVTKTTSWGKSKTKSAQPSQPITPVDQGPKYKLDQNGKIKIRLGAGYYALNL